MGVTFDNVDMKQAIETAMGYIAKGERCRIVTPNAEIGQGCKNDVELREIINASQLVLADGIGVIYASKILGTPLKCRVPGVEFGERLIEVLSKTDKSVFLFGGKPGVAERAAESMKKKYPGIKVAGTLNGYYKSENEVVNVINASKCDALLIFLGAPKQERFMSMRGSVINATLLAGLGGSVDVWAGETKRAPDIFIKLGLEWFYRLLKQPQRLGRMMKLPVYLMSAVGYRLRGGQKQ